MCNELKYHRSHPPQAAFITTKLSLGCNMRSFHSVRGIILLFTAMATPLSGSASCEASSAMVHPSFAVYFQFHKLVIYEFVCKYKELLLNRIDVWQEVTIPSSVLTASGSQGIISARLSVGTPLLLRSQR